MNNHHIQTTVTLDDGTDKYKIVMRDGHVDDITPQNGDSKFIRLINHLITNPLWLELLQKTCQKQSAILKFTNEEETK